VTLRTDIRTAIDAVAPPVPGLRRTAMAAVRAEREQRGAGSSGSGRPRRAFLSGVRHAGAIAAVLIVVLLIVGLFAGGRILHDWKRFTPPPQPASHATFDELRARPIVWPVLKASDACPVSPDQLFTYGVGPVYGIGGGPTPTPWGTYFNVSWVIDPSITGPVIIRGHDLRSNRTIVFVGPYSAGTVFGMDGDKVQFPELHLDASHPPSHTVDPPGFGLWPVTQGVANGWSHCFGFQIDGTGFTELITGNG
jgi:hypothetical protein